MHFITYNKNFSYQKKQSINYMHFVATELNDPWRSSTSRSTKSKCSIHISI